MRKFHEKATTVSHYSWLQGLQKSISGLSVIIWHGVPHQLLALLSALAVVPGG